MTMSNLDEQKIKSLLKTVVRDIEDHYTQHTFSLSIEDIINRIESADILTDQPACATVKHQKGQDQLDKKFIKPKE